MKSVAIALGIPALFLTSGALAQEDQFKAFDTNGDGRLSVEEVKAAMPKTTDKDIAAIDLNGDGSLTYDEFEIGMEEGFLVAN
jgi:hypothetical protein